MTRRPVLGLAVAGPMDDLLVDAAHALARWCGMRQATPDEPVDGWLATDTRPQPAVGARSPLLVWTTDPDGARRRWPATAVLLVPSSVTRDAGENSVVLPQQWVDASAVAYAPPSVRARARRVRGVTAAVVDIRGSDSAGAHRAARQLASVVVATGRPVLAALASGAPTVTDPETAAAYALEGCVAVAEPDRLLDAAEELATRPLRLAELSWRGRAHIEAAHDLVGAVGRALRLAGVVRRTDAVTTLTETLAELWATPRSALAIATRVGAAP